jgi:hypothetical protein
MSKHDRKSILQTKEIISGDKNEEESGNTKPTINIHSIVARGINGTS